MGGDGMSRAGLLEAGISRLLELDRSDLAQAREAEGLRHALAGAFERPDPPEVLFRRELWEAGLDVLRLDRDPWNQRAWKLRFCVEPEGEVLGFDVSHYVLYEAKVDRVMLPGGRTGWVSLELRRLAESIARQARGHAKRKAES